MKTCYIILREWLEQKYRFTIFLWSFHLFQVFASPSFFFPKGNVMQTKNINSPLWPFCFSSCHDDMTTGMYKYTTREFTSLSLSLHGACAKSRCGSDYVSLSFLVVQMSLFLFFCTIPYSRDHRCCRAIEGYPHTLCCALYVSALRTIITTTAYTHVWPVAAIEIISIGPSLGEESYISYDSRWIVMISFPWCPFLRLQ